MDANNCPTCACKTDSVCEKGTPQGECEIEIEPFPSKPCPSGTYCINSVCCKIPCDYGDPHPTRFCGMVVSSNKCPTGYHCKGGPADEYHACCPNAKTTKIGRCPRDKYPRTYCNVQRHCKNDASCPGTKKCCEQGCRYKCVYPLN
ncbi:whey acidic protein-like [Mytilus edulis]|uniref:whey acidic protein-like n=1 Tax=Mytilus edulis TaxID=6550 RepID=UPI0039F0120C